MEESKTSVKIQEFANKVQEDQKEHFEKTYPDTEIDFWKDSYTVHVKPGRKYTKVDVYHSDKYMVVNETGEIYGIKGYGVIHKGHYYGTLETMNEWNWGGFHAHKLVS